MSEEVDVLYKKLDEDARSAGYHLNPDVKFTKALVKSLITNEKEIRLSSMPV